MTHEWTWGDVAIVIIAIVMGYLQINGSIGSGARYVDAMYDLYDD